MKIRFFVLWKRFYKKILRNLTSRFITHYKEKYSLASLVHTFVNLVDGVSWEVEKQEIREFLPMQTWKEQLISYGFTPVSTKQLILQEDPTANAMTIFVKTPKNLEELQQAVAYRKNYQRPKDCGSRTARRDLRFSAAAICR